MDMKNMEVNMVSMASEKEKPEGKEVEQMDQPRYPWGLRLNLDGKSWDKIASGVTPTVGEKMPMMIEVEVIGLRSEKNMGEEPEIYVDLQVTAMSFCEMKKEKMSFADKLYAKKG